VAGPDQGRGGDRDEAAAWAPGTARDHGTEPEAAGQEDTFRLPSPDERAARAASAAAARAASGDSARGDDFWDRLGEEIAASGSQDPARPAWPATAGPRAMGPAATAGSGTGTGDDEQAGWDRMVPPYVDDLTKPRKPRVEPAGADRAGEPRAEDTAATAGRDPGNPWSAWSSARADPVEAAEPAETEPEDTGPGEPRPEDTGSGETGPEDAGTGEADRATDTDAAVTPDGGGAPDGPSDAEQDPEGSPADRAAGENQPEDTAGAENEDTAGAEEADVTGEDSASLDEEVTVVPGVARYHRRGCILIRFLSDDDLETRTRREAQAAGSVPCKACQPDNPGPSA
jgi:hypothetical protein